MKRERKTFSQDQHRRKIAAKVTVAGPRIIATTESWATAR